MSSPVLHASSGTVTDLETNKSNAGDSEVRAAVFLGNVEVSKFSQSSNIENVRSSILPLLRSFPKMLPEGPELEIHPLIVAEGVAQNVASNNSSLTLVCLTGNAEIHDVESRDIGAGDIFFVPQSSSVSLRAQSGSAAAFITIRAPHLQDLRTPSTYYHCLVNSNEQYLQEFRDNALFKLVRKHTLRNDELRRNFFDCLQVWSNNFQKMVLARQIFTNDKEHSKVAYHHLVEEFGHDKDLEKLRKKGERIQDAVLEATAAWFPWKILSLDDAGKLILVHMVVEASADIFYEEVTQALPEKLHHFDMHNHLDCHHKDMGMHLIKRMDRNDFFGASNVLDEGWQMLNTNFARIAELIKPKIS